MGPFIAEIRGLRSTTVGLASSSSTTTISTISIAVAISVAVTVSIAVGGFLRAVRRGGGVGLLALCMVVRVRERRRGRLGWVGLRVVFGVGFGVGLGGGLGVVVRAAAAAAWPGLAALAVGRAPLDGGHDCVLLGEVLNDTARYTLVGDVAVAECGRCRECQRKEDEALVDGRHCCF